MVVMVIGHGFRPPSNLQIPIMTPADSEVKLGRKVFFLINGGSSPETVLFVRTPTFLAKFKIMYFKSKIYF